ncbi:MAG TPA: DUF222 domain-containing protein [Pseudolysinimonas sp.]
MTSIGSLASAYARLGDVSVAFIPPSAGSLSDDSLLESQRVVAEIRRRADAAAAVLAAEVAHRSRRELGYGGLATRLGARTPELLVARVTGTSAREAGVLVRVGAMTTEPRADAAEPDPTPWLAAAGAAVRGGALSLDAADAIRAGLGAPDDSVSAQSLSAAAVALVADAALLTVEQLATRAREVRAELDAAHVRDREAALREARYLRLTAEPDGMTRLTGRLDPESAAVIVAAYDAATSPRRGGPRFIDPDAAAASDELLRDVRTTDQVAVDALVELVRLGSAADPAAIPTAHRPAVRVAVAERDLRIRLGAGRIEGQTQPISIDTIERAICEVGMIPILFDNDGQVVNIGRDQRLFTRRQRIGLALRDGGCRFPGCDRPPSWCEAHHIDEWYRHGGRTDLADGILLCRHHHLLVHNNDWRIIRDGAAYFAVPPPSLDPDQQPIAAPSRSAVARRVLAEV